MLVAELFVDGESGREGHLLDEEGVVLGTLPDPDVLELEELHLGVQPLEGDRLVLETGQVVGLLVLLVVPDRLEPELFQVEVGREVVVQHREVVLRQGAQLGTVVGLAHDLVLLDQVEAHQQSVLLAHEGGDHVHHVLVLLLLADGGPQEEDDAGQLVQLSLAVSEQVSQHLLVQALSGLDAHLVAPVLVQLAPEVPQHALREVTADVVERELARLKQLLDEQFRLLPVATAQFDDVELLLTSRRQQTVDDAVRVGRQDFLLCSGDVVVFGLGHVCEQLVPLPAVQVARHPFLLLLQ